MQHLEWTTVDKTEWPDGPWKSEPDKLQWLDEATGLPCLIRRNHAGALCGYVGVTSDHPLYGQNYNDVYLNFDVHGGLTFSKGCTDFDQLWLTYHEHAKQAVEEAKIYPSGDYAQFLAEWGDLLSDREAFNKRAQATTICHIPAEGEPDDIWWFGFDCAHFDDLSPRLEWAVRRIELRFDLRGTYRDIAYVQRECASLARQLKAAADSVLTLESL